MFAPISPATLIQTVHGLAYRVNPVTPTREDDDAERPPQSQLNQSDDRPSHKRPSQGKRPR